MSKILILIIVDFCCTPISCYTGNMNFMLQLWKNNSTRLWNKNKISTRSQTGHPEMNLHQLSLIKFFPNTENCLMFKGWRLLTQSGSRGTAHQPQQKGRKLLRPQALTWNTVTVAHRKLLKCILVQRHPDSGSRISRHVHSPLPSGLMQNFPPKRNMPSTLKSNNGHGQGLTQDGQVGVLGQFKSDLIWPAHTSSGDPGWPHTEKRWRGVTMAKHIWKKTCDRDWPEVT